MARCNCSGQTCGCRIIAGAGVTIEGSGTARDPWVVSADGSGGGGGGGGGFDPGDFKETSRTDTPAGWLECNGQTVSRTGYPALFAAIGTRWGAGDGFSTFQVPPLGGRVRVGVGPGYALAASGGSAETVLAVANLPVHSHTVQNHQHDLGNHTHSDAHEHGNTGGVSANHVHGLTYKVDTADNTTTGGTGKRVTDVKIGTGSSNAATGGQNVDHFHGVAGWGGRTDGPTPGVTSFAGGQTTSSTGSGAAFTNMPPWRAVRVLIRT